MKMFEIEAHEVVCGNCKHYEVHYIKAGQRKGWSMVTPTNCGHCMYPRHKHRRPGEPGCEHFEEGATWPDC